MDAEPRTTGGLTLLEAEQRIDALEDALKSQPIIAKHTKSLLDCVYLLFDELRVEGLKHSQFVEDSLARTAKAVDELQRAIRDSQRFGNS